MEKLDYIYGEILRVNPEPMPAPGIDGTDVIQALAELGLTPDPTLPLLYERHNGICYLNAFLNFKSLEDACSVYSLDRKFPDPRLPRTAFPIFDINGDIQIYVDFMSGALIGTDREDGRIWLISEHYIHMIDAVAEVFHCGLFGYDEESGSIEVEDSDWESLARKYSIHW